MRAFFRHRHNVIGFPFREGDVSQPYFTKSICCSYVFLVFACNVLANTRKKFLHRHNDLHNFFKEKSCVHSGWFGWYIWLSPLFAHLYEPVHTSQGFFELRSSCRLAGPLCAGLTCSQEVEENNIISTFFLQVSHFLGMFSDFKRTCSNRSKQCCPW